MNSTYSNPCIRCGKQRVVGKIWKEKVGYSVVTTTESACPDIECQKIVDKSNKDRKDRYQASKLKRKLGFNHKKKYKKPKRS